MITAKCEICGLVFIKRNKSKLSACSGSCTLKLSNMKKNGITELELKKCIKCEVEKRKARFYGGKRKWGWCIDCHIGMKEPLWQQMLNDPDWKDLKAIDVYLKKIKNQAFYATDIDILQLIHYYCIVFPDEWQGRLVDDETLFEMMFLRLANWWRSEKEAILKRY